MTIYTFDPESSGTELREAQADHGVLYVWTWHCTQEKGSTIAQQEEERERARPCCFRTGAWTTPGSAKDKMEGLKINPALRSG